MGVGAYSKRAAYPPGVADVGFLVQTTVDANMSAASIIRQVKLPEPRFNEIIFVLGLVLFLCHVLEWTMGQEGDEGVPVWNAALEC